MLLHLSRCKKAEMTVTVFIAQFDAAAKTLNGALVPAPKVRFKVVVAVDVR